MKRIMCIYLVIVIVLCVFALMIGLTACTNILPESEKEIDNTFEQDYALIEEITSYLLALEEGSVYIDCREKEIMGGLGEPMEFQSPEIEQIVEKLKNKGYYYITKTDNVVYFDVWRKSFLADFGAGFVYSVEGSGDLSEIVYLTYQRPLSKQNWYYYEDDYNEWRVNRHNK